MQTGSPPSFYNTLTRTKEPFAPLAPGRALIYTCGPTVYRNAHIGNLRSYLLSDWLRRLLEALGYSVRHVKNITDVGHMRQDMLERGDDKVIAAARAAGKTPQEIAGFYTDAFFRDEHALGILPAHEFPRASAYVDEMVALTRTLVDKGYAYEAAGNVYFEVRRFADYGKLSGQRGEGLEVGDRVEVDPLKRHPRDFALWKAAEPGRDLKWPSPWGEGFPGWHIECSAMVLRLLGEAIDFHTGGVDNIFPHHEDEIAQSEAALGKRHVTTWMHGQHLLVDGLKMAKSSRNTYLVEDLQRRGFDPLAFRYLCATARYRSRLNFTFASLRAAQRGLERLRAHLREADGRVTQKAEREAERLRGEFWERAADDLDLPGSLAVAWRAARSRLPGALKRELLLDFDRLLGLDLARAEAVVPVTAEARTMLEERHVLRKERTYAQADEIRSRLKAQGYEVRDTPAGSSLIASAEALGEDAGISSSRDVNSLLESPPETQFTVSIVARDGCRELERCIASVRKWLTEERGEIIVVDNGFEDDECVNFIDSIAGTDDRMKVFHADHFLGSAAARNVSLKQARGNYVVFMDTSVELTGDIFGTIASHLQDPEIGVAGRWGVVSNDLRSFEEAESSGDVDAVEGYLMAFRRETLREVGFLDEKYRFYRHLDLDFSFAVRSRGYRAVVDTALPAAKHDHVDWNTTPQDERERLSKRNFYRFLQKWGERTDLLVTRG